MCQSLFSWPLLVFSPLPAASLLSFGPTLYKWDFFCPRRWQAKFYHKILNFWLFWWKHSRQSWWSLELSSSPSLLSPTRKSEVMSSWWDILVGMNMRGDTGDIGLVTILWHWWHCCLFLSNCKPLVPRLTSSSWPQPQSARTPLWIRTKSVERFRKIRWCNI